MSRTRFKWHGSLRQTSQILDGLHVAALQTALMPNAGNVLERVEYVAAVVESDRRNGRRLVREGKLFVRQQVMKLPGSAESVKRVYRLNTNRRANFERVFIGVMVRHRRSHTSLTSTFHPFGTFAA